MKHTHGIGGARTPGASPGPCSATHRPGGYGDADDRSDAVTRAWAPRPPFTQARGARLRRKVGDVMKCYPSRTRVRKAFERGVKDGYQHNSRHNPYRNGRLHELYNRGYGMGKEGKRPRLPRGRFSPSRPTPPKPDTRPRPFAPAPKGRWQ